MISGAGDRYYSGSGPSTAAVSFTISGTASVALDSIVVYLKYTDPSLMPGSWANYFTVTLDGVSATQQELGGTGEFIGQAPDVQQMGVVRLSWTGLALGAGEAFSVSISRPAAGMGEPGHVSVDGIQIVPEPTAAALAGLGLGGLALRRRRPARIAPVGEN
jgi:hypothetical protein